MTHTPPVPEANQSPYPIEEAPHQHADLPPVQATSEADPESLKQRAEALVEKVGDFGAENRTIAGIGAAIALGAIATVTAILFTRRTPAKPAPAKRRQASAKPRARKTPARKAA